MKTIVLSTLLLIASSLPLGAQAARFTTGPRYGLSVYGGYMQFDNLFRATNGVSYSNGNAGQVGVQAGVSLNSIIAVLGNVTHARPRAHVALGADAPFAAPDVGVWLLDGDVQFRVPLGYLVTPFVQVGVGAARYRVRVNGAHHGSTGAAFNAALGADVPLFRNVRLVLMAKDYILSFDWAAVGDPRFDDHLKSNTTTNIGVSLGLEIGY